VPSSVVIVGSSVSLYVRPPRATRDQGTYVELLARALGPAYRIDNIARVSYDIRDALHGFHKQLLPIAPDVVVLHLGVNESVSRFLPRRLWRVVYGGGDRVTSPGLVRRAMMLLDAAMRPVMTRFLPRAWFGAHEFERLTDEFLVNVRKEFAARIVVVGITRPSDRVEKQLRGSISRVRDFNAALARSAAAAGATFIDVDAIADRDDLHPDGIHFSAAGHAWLAERLAGAIR
jgi:lysophospholipase L1-like esterase